VHHNNDTLLYDEMSHKRRCWSRLAVSVISSIATIEADMLHFAFGPGAEVGARPKGRRQNRLASCALAQPMTKIDACYETDYL
jgi:hypothetical protein